MPGVNRNDFLAGPPKVTVAGAVKQVKNALALAGLALIVSVPMSYFQFLRLKPHYFTGPVTDHQLRTLAVGQGLIVFGLALVCSLVGFLYAHRLSLPGFGKVSDLIRWAPLALALGLAFGLFSYVAIDREILARMPSFFPVTAAEGLLQALGKSLGQEVVLRFGLVTICVYLLRWRGFKGHPWPAGMMVGLFMSCERYLFLSRLELAPVFGVSGLAFFLAANFALHWALSEAYLRWGLVVAIALHCGWGLRLIAYALL